MKIPANVLRALKDLVGDRQVLTDETSLLLNGYDCSLSRARPDAVVLLPTADCIAPVITLLSKHHIPFVARAAATNHAGSCAPMRGGIVLSMTKLNRILQIDTQHQFAWVEPGVVTAQLQQELRPLGFFYAPDPASERVCTLGGNLAQNASGARCLKYGGTIDHILAVNVVLPNGNELFLSRKDNGPDLIGLLCGSEGTLGIITKLQVKILPLAQQVETLLATFPSLEDCVQSVTDLVSHGIIPRCVEAMDQITAQAVEGFAHAGYPTDQAALLILELEGTKTQMQQDLQHLQEICTKNKVHSFIKAQTAEQRENLWLGRRAAYAAMARLSPNVMVGDGTVPRSELPKALAGVRKILDKNGVFAGLLFHAGDGNFHPHLMFDERNKPETKRISQVLRQILQVCVDCGGTVSGEHGIGVEKRALMAYQYDQNTLALFAKIKQATDPQNLANPLKIIPLDFAEKVHPSTNPYENFSYKIQSFAQRKTPFHIVGHNTRFPSELVPQVSTKSLNRILEIDLQNYTVTAQAGVSLCNLQKTLTGHHLYNTLPAGPGTLGGAFSSGQFPHFYSQITGIVALLPDGSCVQYGGKVTKNAAGYNLIRLFAGAQGRLGLVTQLTFKVFATSQSIPDAVPFPQSPWNAWAQKLANQLDPLHLLNQENA